MKRNHPQQSILNRRSAVSATLIAFGLTTALIIVLPANTTAEKKHPPTKVEQVSANRALVGVPLDFTPDQLPKQFRTQLREDVKASHGFGVLRQHGNDVEYTFAWEGMTSPVISGHFHKAPHGQVGVRAYSICGVAKESPPCPEGTRNSISGVWKDADIDAFKRGEITIAFHTKVYPAPIGEIAAYIPAAR